MDRELISTVSARSGNPPFWTVFFVTSDEKENNKDPALEAVVVQSSSVDVNVCFQASDLQLASEILRWMEALPLAIQKSLRSETDERELAWKKGTKTVEPNRLADLLSKGDQLLNQLKQSELFHHDTSLEPLTPTIKGYAYCFLRDDFIEEKWLEEYFEQNRSCYRLSDLLKAWIYELDQVANRSCTENLGRACQALGVLSSIESVIDALRIVQTFVTAVRDDYPTGVPTEEYLRRAAKEWTGKHSCDSLVWKFKQCLLHH